jgi:hypothetical protein
VTFSFVIINAHIEIYFIVCIAFLDVVHYKTLNTRLDILLLVINPPKSTQGPRCTFNLPLFVIDDKHLEFFNNEA